MVRRAPPMSQSEFEGDNGGESWRKFEYGGEDVTKTRGPW